MKRYFTILLVATLGFTPLFAQDMSLSQALAQARATSTTSKNATLTLEKQLNQTQVNSYLPSIDLSLKANANASLLDESYTASITPTVGLSFSLSSADKYTDDEQQLLYRTAQNTYTSTLNNLESSVSTAYWNTVAANLSVQAQRLEVAEKQTYLESVEQQYEGGTATTLHVSQAKLSLKEAELTLQEKEQALQSAKQTLSTLTGSEVENTTDPLAEIQDIKELSELKSLVYQTTTINALELAVEEAELAYKQASNTSLSPTLSFDASTTFSAQLATEDSKLKDSTTLTVSLAFPLDAYLPNSQAQVTLENFEQDIQIAKNSLEGGITESIAQVQAAYLAIEQAIVSLEYLTSYKTVAAENHVLTLASYEAGEIPYISLTESENQVSTANLAILQQQVQYTLALYDLSFLLEVNVPELLQK